MNDSHHDSLTQEQTEVLLEQALDLYDLQLYRECLALLDQVLPLERDNAHIYYCRGNTRYELRDYRGAAAEYLWALRQAPYFAEAAANLGNAYHNLKQYEKSLLAHKRAAHLAPNDGDIFYNCANTLAAVGRLSEAALAFSTSIQLKPTFASGYLNRGNTLSRLGRHEEALADYRQAVTLSPDDSNIAWTVAWAHFGKEALTETVVQELGCISCLAPDEWDPHFWTGVVAALQGELQAAQQAIEKALEVGLPPLLLAPLYWLKLTRADFFEQYACGLLQRFGI